MMAVVLLPSQRSREGQPPDSDALVLEHCDGSDHEVSSDAFEVGEQHRSQACCGPRCPQTEQDDRGASGSALGEQEAKVGVRRDEHSILVKRSPQDDLAG